MIRGFCAGGACYNIFMDLFNKTFFHLAFGFISIVMISVLVIIATGALGE